MISLSSSGDARLGCLQYLAILNNAALNILINVSMCICIGAAAGEIHRIEIVGSNGIANYSLQNIVLTYTLILIVCEDACFLYPYQLRYYGILIFTRKLCQKFSKFRISKFHTKKVCHCCNVYFHDSGKVKYLKIISNVISHSAKNSKYQDTTTIEQKRS